MISVREGNAGDIEACVDVLASLPEYFTTDTYDDLRRRFPEHRSWVATDGDTGVVGFVLVEHRYERSAEITFAAVLPDHHGRGIGTALVDTALSAARSDGVALVEVKTLDSSSGYEPYEATRAFWERRGFHQVDCIDPLPGWQPGNPAAIYIAALD
jgi:ribosomal protein S18 acetylase RimI-like enzyme